MCLGILPTLLLLSTYLLYYLGTYKYLVRVTQKWYHSLLLLLLLLALRLPTNFFFTCPRPPSPAGGDIKNNHYVGLFIHSFIHSLLELRERTHSIWAFIHVHPIPAHSTWPDWKDGGRLDRPLEFIDCSFAKDEMVFSMGSSLSPPSSYPAMGRVCLPPWTKFSW